MLESDVVTPQPLLEAVDVHRYFGRRSPVRAVDGVDVRIEQGRSVGIAGESGSGKSTLLRLLLRLQETTSGTISHRGTPLAELSGERLAAYHRGVQAVFQDPGGSFNPRHRIRDVITEPARVANGLSSTQRVDLARTMLASVDLPMEFADRFPHELSGGQRQRVAIARALSCRPEVILLDEPVTALDISIRGTIINLLVDRANEGSVTYAVVSHDLTAIYHMTEYLYVMRRGVVVEEGPTAELIETPLHPYTRRLVDAIGDPLAGHRSAGERLADDDAEGLDERVPDLVEVAPGRRARLVRPEAAATQRI